MPKRVEKHERGSTKLVESVFGAGAATLYLGRESLHPAIPLGVVSLHFRDGARGVRLQKTDGRLEPRSSLLEIIRAARERLCDLARPTLPSPTDLGQSGEVAVRVALMRPPDRGGPSEVRLDLGSLGCALLVELGECKPPRFFPERGSLRGEELTNESEEMVDLRVRHTQCTGGRDLFDECRARDCEVGWRRRRVGLRGW